MRKKSVRAVAAVLAGMMMLSGCGGQTQNDQSSSQGASGASSGTMTDVGTPREETLIVDILSGRQTDPDNCNPYMTGAVALDCGLLQLVYPQLWDINTIEGEQFCDLAAEFPQPVDDTNTKFRFKIREGITWSDGEEFTAEDVEFTAKVLQETESYSWSSYFNSIIKSMTAVDKYTVEMEMVNPDVKPQQKLGTMTASNAFRILPKHVWENEDWETFKYTDPLSLGPYVLTDRDPQGNWFLYEKRDDWENSDVGVINGEPNPQYILFKYFGSEEKRVMAAVNNELDVMMDISPESWDILREKNPNAICWTTSYPYATPDDPCERGISFNCANELFANKEVRWALTLCMDIKEVSMATFGGKLKFSPVAVPPTTTLMETYQKPMLDWLKEYSFEDGYKPFDENIPKEMVEMLKSEGVEDLPTTDEEITDIFGIGWWKYDTEKATELLEKNGFTLEDGQWMTPDGEPFEIVLSTPADFEIESMRLNFAVADAWNKFGIKAEVKQQDSSTYWSEYANGNFEVGGYWPYCGTIADTTENMSYWNKKYVVPVGQSASGNKERWSNDTVSQKLDELQALTPDDPKVVENVTEILKVLVDEIPALPMFGTAKFVPAVETYWTGFPTAENPYEGPWWWWSGFKFFTTEIKPQAN